MKRFEQPTNNIHSHMSGSYPTKKMVFVPLSRLRPHPQQAVLFPDLPEPELEALAEDMKANGQVQAIEILPDYTIVCGHQRVAAAKQLGWEKICCWVRHDLATASAVEQRLVEDNLNRRQLTKLEIARCYQRLRQLESGTKAERRGTGDLRDLIGQRFSISGRTLDRWVSVLDAPVEVQRAFDCGAISLAMAAQVTKLSDKAQGQIAEQIAAGEEPQSVIRKYLQQKSSPQCPLASAVTRLSGLLECALQDPDRHPSRAPAATRISTMAALKKCRQLINKLVASIGDNQ